MKRIVILGSTGSIGRNVLDVVARHPDEFAVVGMASRARAELLAEQAKGHPEAKIAITDDVARARMRASGACGDRLIDGGEEALDALIETTRPDLVVNAVVGFVGLRPTMTALRGGIPVAIANKETVVTGGQILLEAAREGDAALIPIDSEHVAIAQCLSGENPVDIDKVIVTASGGALRERDSDDLEGVTIDDVLAHPTWEMGPKITVDSATLVNKGLELIEAHWLFALPYEKIDVVIHPQSIVHSMVRFIDGSIIAQLGEPDMRLPILYALSYPRRIRSAFRHDVLAFPDLTFREVDRKRYPCFDLVLDAARRGGNAPAVLNAANEVAVEGFLSGDIPFTGIHDVIAGALAAVTHGEIHDLNDIIETDAATRRWIAATYRLPGNATSNAQGGN